VNAQASKALAEIVTRYGQNVVDDPRRLRALLSDHCPGMKREVNVLVAAAQHKVVADLQRSATGLPWSSVLGRLVRRMTDELSIDETIAQWAVEAWAAALGKPAAVPRPGPRPQVGVGSTPPDASPRPSRPSGRKWPVAWASLALAVFTIGIIWIVAARTGERNKDPGPVPALPGSLKKEYDEFRASAMSGRGSVAYLRRAASPHFADWLSRAESGEPVAQLFVGRCYQEGMVVRKDDAAAIPWLEKSAAQGNAFAMLSLGNVFELGRGVAIDRARALSWYTRAANAGEAMAMQLIGRLYEQGISDKPEPDLAFSWYKKGAEAGDPGAMRIVGNCYRYGTGVAKDPAESERWSQRAAEAGDAYTVGKNLGERLSTAFADYLAEGASAARKAISLEILKELKSEYMKLDFACVGPVYSDSDLRTNWDQVEQLPADDPLRVLKDELIERYMTLYSEAAHSERVANVSSFSLETETLMRRWFSDSRYDDVARFWDRAYADISSSELGIIAEYNGLVHELDWSIISLIRIGKRKEGKNALRVALELCDAILGEHPWDWYLKDAYTGLCFDVASTLAEVGEPGDAQTLLKRGWTVRLKQYGKEALLERYPVLPLKGEVPAGADDSDREFFQSFAKGAAPGKSGMKRFTFPADFAGKKYPFHVYVLSGPRGYAELQDQFRWLNEMRGGEVPVEVRDSFERLNKIAVESHVDFQEQCVSALATAPTEASGKASSPAAKD
jgi:hypothetical protein